MCVRSFICGLGIREKVRINLGLLLIVRRMMHNPRPLLSTCRLSRLFVVYYFLWNQNASYASFQVWHLAGGVLAFPLDRKWTTVTL